MTLLVALSILGTLVLLVAERRRLDRSRERIPVVIAVTGTRGKSSVTRMLASVLRESGRRALAKATGSEAALIYPDGSEIPVRRRGRASILEQKRVMQLGARLRVDAVVVEMMSIHAENHYVEAQRILRPDVLVATNFRVDHTEAQGTTRDDVAAVLGLDVTPGANVIVPAAECSPAFRSKVRQQGARLLEVAGDARGVEQRGVLAENEDLVYAAARHLGIDDRTIAEGIRRTRYDRGALGIWRYRPADGSEVFLVNAFAANDPESTRIVHHRVSQVLRVDADRCVGLLSLRADRGDRTVQWLEALRDGTAPRFRRLYAAGFHSRALARQLRSSMQVAVLSGTSAAELTQAVASELSGVGGIVFGFGNFGGVGSALAAHWRAIGAPWPE